MLTLSLLGGLELAADGTRLELPQSRKTRALLAYLAMSDRPVRRERLCEVFWQVPDDPKGALRWSLSKLRPLVSADGLVRIDADRTAVSLRRNGLQVDALTLRRAGAGQIDALPPETLEALAAICGGGFLDDLDLPDAHEFRAWKLAQREHLRAIETAVRRRLVSLRAGTEAAVRQAYQLVEIAPDEEANHVALIEALLQADHVREAQEQRELSATRLRDLGVEPGPRLLRAAAPRREPVAALAGAPEAMPASDDGAEPATARPRRSVPTVVVSGFRDLGGGQGPDYFVEGMTEEVSRALARMPWLLVLKQPPLGRVSASRAAEIESEADYLLTGAVMRAGDRVRMTYSLLDRETGATVLADRIETEMADILTAQDEIASRIVAALEPTIRLAEIEALRRRRRVNLDSYDFYLRGWALAFGATGMDLPGAIAQFEKATEADPENAPAALMLAWLGMQQPQNLNAAGMRRCAELARTALRYSSNDGTIIAHAAYVLIFAERDWDLGLRLARQAKALSPYSPYVWFSCGWVHVTAGETEAALAAFERSVAVTATHPFAYIAYTGLANTLFQLGRTADAVAAGRIATAENPTFHPGWRILAAALAEHGDAAEAAAAVERLRALAPHESQAFVRAWLPYRRPEQLERLVEALGRAGLPAAVPGLVPHPGRQR
jgi:DNA-binding SARP family transcriptional activator/TolB-like protein